MSKSHYVVIPSDDGEPNRYPLKQWLRENLYENPPGMHPDDSTSHELRRGLKKLGWKIEFAPTEVLILKPDSARSFSYANGLLDTLEATDPIEVSDLDEENVELTFGLERDLQRALRANISQLESGLKIIDGGTEMHTDAGRIDILAEDESGVPVVVELKAGRATSRVIAQVLAYMTAISESSGKQARGIIVAGDFEERVSQAARAVPMLSLHCYTYNFAFRSLS